MPANIHFTSRLGALPRLKLGDRVLVQPGTRQGIVIGVRYGEIAYDVRCASECLRNLCPKQIRRASLSVVEASLYRHGAPMRDHHSPSDETHSTGIAMRAALHATALELICGGAW